METTQDRRHIVFSGASSRSITAANASESRASETRKPLGAMSLAFKWQPDSSNCLSKHRGITCVCVGVGVGVLTLGHAINSRSNWSPTSQEMGCVNHCTPSKYNDGVVLDMPHGSTRIIENKHSCNFDSGHYDEPADLGVDKLAWELAGSYGFDMF